MATQVRCPKGHLWGLDDFADADPFDPTAPVACPFCGALCTLVADASNVRWATNAGPEPADELPQSAFPGYQIIGQLGRGGMGVVYKARQIHTDRLVAIKVPDRTDLESAIRFATEAKAAARVQSPNIVQVYEVGQQAERSYLIMEFCPGGTLADRLDGTPLPVRPVATLVEAVARAVGSAHAAGVVHRDLKPANILLVAKAGADPNGPFDPDRWVPKVTDFGLARRLDVDQGQTQSGMILGTPKYMAPEQATGENRAVGPAADVYALGVILYELLTGRPPFWGTNPLETLDQIRGTDPVPPARLRPHLPRDLETICLKCLHKDPARRYPSADALAADLARFLGGHPIEARPVSRFEHLVKRARRNPVITALAAVLCVVVVGAIAYGVWYQVQLQRERDQARHERDKARKHFAMSTRSIQGMLTEVAEVDLVGERLADPKQKKLLEKALQFYEELLQIEADDIELAWLAAQAARRVGDIHLKLGGREEARAAYAAALERLEPLTAVPDYHDQARREQAECQNWLGEIEREFGDPARAAELYARALAIQLELHTADPDNPEYRKDLARTRYNRGILAMDGGQAAAAVTEFGEALTWLDGLSAADRGVRHHRARVYLNLGPAHRMARELSQADAACAEAVRLLEGLADEFPDRPEYRLELAADLLNHGNVSLDRDDPAGARALTERARDLLERLAAEHPLVPRYRAKLARSFNSLAVIADKAGEPKTAARHAYRAVELWEVLVKEQDETEYHAELGMAMGNLARAVYQPSAPDARAHLTRGIGELLLALNAKPSVTAFRNSIRLQLRDLAGLMVWARHHEAARRQATTLAEALPGRPYGTFLAVCFMAACAKNVTGEGAAAEVDRYARHAINLIGERPSDELLELLRDRECDSLRAHHAFAAAIERRKD